MPVSVTIEPFTPSIDMYDSPDTSSAYSLSGHITIAASSSSSILGLSRSSTHNLTLSSLELTFEGQSELLLTDVGYAPLRLISITKELVSPSHPVQITADEDRAEWRVVFNLAIPGWLPATSNFGKEENQDEAGVSYALYARARFHPARADIDDAPAATAAASSSTSSMWTNLCSVVRLGGGRPKLVQAEKVPIRLTRYVSPPTRAYSAEDASPPPFPLSTFAVQALSECTLDENLSTNIPAEILRSVELHTVVPSRTSVEDDSVPLLLRLRSRLNDEATRSRLRVLGFEANIMQVEEFHTSPLPSYTSRFPLPPFEEQPPIKPLRSTHPIGTLFDIGLIGLLPTGKQVVNERSIVPDGTSKHFKVRGDEDSDNDGVSIEHEWLRMEVDVPVTPGLQESNQREKGKRVAGSSPFLEVKHEMRVRLTVGYEQASGGNGGRMPMLSDELAFMVPLEFVLVTPTSPLASAFFPVLAHTHQNSTSSLPLPHPRMTPSPLPSPIHSLSRSHSLSSLSSTNASLLSSPLPPLLSIPPLPAYNQLFHENGDRKDDIQIALPLYREKEEDDVHSHSHSPVLQHPRRALSASSSSSRSSSSRSSSAVSSLEHDAPTGIFPTPMGVSMPLPRLLEHFVSPPGPPASPGITRTPPGLADFRALALAPVQGERQGKGKGKNRGRKGKESKSKGKTRETSFGESFLRFDDDEDPERGGVHEPRREHPEAVIAENTFEDGDRESVRGEIQYGIAL